MPALHAQAIRASIVLISLISLVGCFGGGGRGDAFTQDSLKCSARTIANQFMIRWKNGSLQVVSGITREELMEKIVEPNLHDIERVDYDRYLDVPEAYAVSAPISPSFINKAPDVDWGVSETGAPEAWAGGVTGAGVKVAVIDTGIDYNHFQLSDQIAKNSGESGVDAMGRDKRFNGIDDDQNGYVDDWLGYNFSWDDANPDDAGSHGTHVSGIIAGKHIEGFPAKGVAPEAKLIPISFIGGPQSGSISAAIRSIDYAETRGADIINASWGGVKCAPSLGSRINELGAKGIVFVAASGNNGLDIEAPGNIEYPAAFNGILQITVGSIGRNLGMADHSNYGKQTVHVFAPGVEILSTLPGDNYGSMTGTSMAAPFVSGALALLKSHRPSATGPQLKQALLAGVTKGTYANSTSGRLDIVNALLKLEKIVPVAQQNSSVETDGALR